MKRYFKHINKSKSIYVLERTLDGDLRGYWYAFNGEVVKAEQCRIPFHFVDKNELRSIYRDFKEITEADIFVELL
jgi:hypothetical protein